MSALTLRMVGAAVAQVLVVLLLAPLYEGVLRKLKAVLQSRMGPPILQPFLDTAKLLGKEDLRTVRGRAYAALPALSMASALLLATMVPLGGRAPFGYAADIVGIVYVSSLSAVLLILTAYSSGSPYAAVGGSREMMALLSVEPVMAVALVVGALKAGTLSAGGILAWNAARGPVVSMVLAGVALLVAIQAQAGKLPFDIPEADQEIMGGPLVEQSGSRLALFRWTLWTKQLALSLVLVELFCPWPRTGRVLLDAILALVKAFVAFVLVAVVDVVNPRLRVDQAMGYYLRVAFASLAALAFAVIGM